LPFLANFDDGIIENAKIYQNFFFLGIIKIVIGIVSYAYWHYKTVFILAVPPFWAKL